MRFIVGPRSDGITALRGCKPQVPLMYIPGFDVVLLCTKFLKNVENTALLTFPSVFGSRSACLSLLTISKAI